MRLFVALEVPAEVRDAVEAATAPLRRRHPRLRWTRPEAWHLTLAFLGEVEPVPVGLPAALTAACAAAPATVGLSLASPGRFGSRVLWLGVADEPSGAVTALGERLQDAVAGLGIAVDRRQVRPHLTLARSRGRDAPVTGPLVDDCPTVPAAWEVSRAVLYRSHLAVGPARYELLAPLALGSPRIGPGS